MATRIESGQIQLRAAGGVPMQQITPRQVDYAGYRAEAQATGTLAQIIDRMSETAFQMAGEAAKERAMVDVANNPLSAQQLELAKNGDMSFMRSGSQFNIYDATLRKARAFELSSAFETEAKAEVVKILADVDSGQLNSESAAAKLNTVTNGFARSLAKVDGDAALKFTASMGVYANTVMAEAYKTEQKRIREKKALMLDADFENTMKLVEPAIGQGFYVDAQGVEQPIENLLSVYRKNLSDHAFAAGGLPLAQRYLSDYDKRVAEAKINAATKLAISDEYMADPVVGLQRLRAGDLGRMSGVYMSMPQDDKSKVLANYMTAVAQRETVRKAAEEAKAQAALREFVPLYNRAVSLPEGNPERGRIVAQIAQIAESNPKVVPLGILSDLQKPNTEGNPVVEFNAMTQIYNGTITTPEQINTLPLTGAQKVRLLGKLVSEDRRSASQLDREISRLAGIPVIPGQMVVIDPKGQEWQRRLELSAAASEFQAKAAADGKVVTNAEVVSYLEKRLMERRNTEDAKAARKSLEIYEKKDWINGKITRDSLPTLERKAGNNKSRQAELTQIRKLLDRAEGVQ